MSDPHKASRILLLEKHRSTRKRLEQGGFVEKYLVDSVESAGELLVAVTQANAEPDPYALVVIDVEVLPFGHAVHALVRLLVEDPELRVILLIADGGAGWHRVIADLPENGRVMVLEHKAAPLVVQQAVRVICNPARRWPVRQAAGEVHARQIEMLGQLAAGIAHEMNTPIQYASDSICFLRDAFATLESAARPAEGEGCPLTVEIDFATSNFPEAIERVEEGLVRVGRIVKSLREFAPAGSGENLEVINVNRLIETTRTVVAGAYHGVARIECDLGEVPDVRCYPIDLGSVFLNLVVNAVQAIEDRQRIAPGDGVVSIATRLENDHVVISFRDDGCGIPDNVGARVFEPFFTTRQVGGGVGQGLTVARAIITNKHGGRLSFSSSPGTGSTFYVELPIPVAHRNLQKEAS